MKNPERSIVVGMVVLMAVFVFLLRVAYLALVVLGVYYALIWMGAL